MSLARWSVSVAARGVMLMLLCASLVSACQPRGAGASPAAEAAQAGAPEAGVTLTAGERARLGIRTATAVAATSRAEVAGYAVVVGHDVIAQAVAEIRTAEAARRQSQAALARLQRLAATPGAFAVESLEAAQRQSTVDAAALALAQRRLSMVVGAHPAWDGQGSRVLAALADGRKRLVRVTFPVGAPTGLPPHGVRLQSLDANGVGTQGNPLWEAPADVSVPGRSWFAVLDSAAVGEGERLRAAAAIGPAVSGVVVAADVVVAYAGQYWCYVEKPAGHFARVALDAQRASDGGYFMAQGVKPGDAVVVAGAGLLLAQEQRGTVGGAD